MQCRVICLFALLGAAAASSTGSPLEKVVNLLKDLQTKTQADANVEQQIYDKFACWCDKTSARKAKAITDAQEALRSLGQRILKLKGKIAVLTAEIAELEEEIEANLKAQKMATAVRQNENAAYMSETDEMKQALAALQKAVVVLREATAAKEKSALLQETAAASKSAVKAALIALPGQADLSKVHMSLLNAFLQGGATYSPQSATVQGILQDMYETFSSDLESKTQHEASQNRAFEDFINVKQEELAAARKLKAEKEADKAQAEEMLADTTQTYDDTEAQLKADVEFFDATKASCEEKHEEWETRKGLRDQELEGIAKAIEILTSDEARELFAKSIKPGKETGAAGKDSGIDIKASFFQVSSENGAPAARAYAVLKEQASRSRSLRLASLAVEVREAKVGHFDKVLAAIDDMVKTLADEGAADIEKRDQCKTEYQEIAAKQANMKWLIENNVARIDKLANLIELRTAEKDKALEDIADVKKEITDMEDQRVAANQAFTEAKTDDTKAIELMMEARAALAKYYKENDIEMGPIQGSAKFLQGEPDFAVSEDQAPDATFSNKGSRKNESKGIVQIMTMLIEDANDEIKNGMKTEEASQLDFEKMRDAAKKLQAELEDKVVNLEGVIAKRGEEKEDEEKLKTDNEADLKDQVDYKKSITSDCDWIVGAFTERADKRTAEMSGLTQAKEFLAGYQSNAAMLETQKFDDKALAKVHFLGLAK